MRVRGRTALAMLALAVSLAVLAPAAPLDAQTPVAAEPPAPPPGRLVPRERPFAVGLGLAALGWDDDAPYDDLTLASLALERNLLRGLLRGRAGIGYGETTLLLEDPADTRVVSLDLQVLLVADVDPLRSLGVEPYGLGGVGSLVVNPVGEEDRELPTRSQTQVTWGGGVLARLGSRWQARAEVVRARVRLADPENAENSETNGIHTLRWEGRIDWVF
jgi:hypothetical protein